MEATAQIKLEGIKGCMEDASVVLPWVAGWVSVEMLPKCPSLKIGVKKMSIELGGEEVMAKSLKREGVVIPTWFKMSWEKDVTGILGSCDDANGIRLSLLVESAVCIGIVLGVSQLPEIRNTDCKWEAEEERMGRQGWYFVLGMWQAGKMVGVGTRTVTCSHIFQKKKPEACWEAVCRSRESTAFGGSCISGLAACWFRDPGMLFERLCPQEFYPRIPDEGVSSSCVWEGSSSMKCRV